MPRNKSERTKAVEKLFSEEANEDGMFKCIVENCGVLVKCASNNGAPGRTSHVRSKHKEEYDKLPKPTVTQKRGADEENRPSQKTKVEKEKPEGILINADKVVDYLARNCEPFSRCEDSLFQGLGLTRRNVVERMAARAKALMLKFSQSLNGSFCTVAIDSGTNGTQRTLNVCAVNGVSRCIGAIRIETHSVASVDQLLEEMLGSDFKLSAFVSDNAANMRLAISTLAETSRPTLHLHLPHHKHRC